MGDIRALASGGRDAPVPSEYAPYLSRFRRRVEEGLHYPLAARRRGISGTVELEVVIDRGGAVRRVGVVLSSSHATLDEAALDAVRALSPQPFPAGMTPRDLTVRLPLVFDLR
jgi:protein TonB